MTKIDSEQPRLADKERGFRVFTTLRDVNGERIGKGGCLIPDKLRRGDFLIDGQSIYYIQPNGGRILVETLRPQKPF